MNADERKAKQAQFLEALGSCASVKAACARVGVSRQTIYNWEKQYKTFAAALAEANKDADDEIDDEIVRRGKQGVDEPLVSMGQLVYEYEPELDDDGNQVYERGKPKMRRTGQVMVRKYSDGLLLALAKSRMKKYRDKLDLDASVTTQSAPGMLSIDTRNCTDNELAMLKAIALAQKSRQTT